MSMEYHEAQFHAAKKSLTGEKQPLIHHRFPKPVRYQAALHPEGENTKALSDRVAN